MGKLYQPKKRSPKQELTRIRKGLPILEPPSPKFVFKTTLGGAAVCAEPQKSTQKTQSASLDNSHRCMQLFTSLCLYAGPTTACAASCSWDRLAHREGIQLRTGAPSCGAYLSLSLWSKSGSRRCRQLHANKDRDWEGLRWGKPNQTVQHQQQWDGRPGLFTRQPDRHS